MRMKSVFVKNVSIFGALVGFLSFPVFGAEDIHVLAYTDDIPTDYVTTNSFITATNQTEYFKRDKADLNVYGTFNSPEIIITNRTYTPNDRSKNYKTVDVEIAPIRLTPKFLGVYKFDDESVDGYTVYRFGDCEAELPLLDGQTKPDKVRIDEIRVASPSDPGKIFFIHSDYLTYDMDSNEYLRHRHGGGLNYVVGHVSTNSYFYEGKTYSWIDVRGASWNFSLTGPLYTDCDVITNKIATKNDILTAADAVMASVEAKGYLTSESDPTTGVTNDVPYVRGKQVLTSESDPVFTAWKSGDFVSVTNGLTTTGAVAKVDAALAAHTADTNNPHKVTASQVGVTLDKGVITIDGAAITPLTSESDPTTGVTNDVPYVRGKQVLTSETDPAWRAWMNGPSVALGKSSVASGSSATAVGYSSRASGSSATANGGWSMAIGPCSTALGWLSKASGFSSTANGYDTLAVGYYSTALGRSSEARGYSSTALGQEARAYANNSVAIGYGAVASNTYAVAIGDGTPSEPYTYEYETIINEDGEEEVITNSSATVIGYAFAAGIHSTALGYMAYAPANSLGLAYTPDTILLCSSNTTKDAGSTARSLQSYLDEKADKSAIPVISASDATFSNAVLGVEGVAKKYTNGGALGVPKDAAIFTADVADGASLVVDNLPTDDAYVTDFVVLVNAAADTQLGKITTTETVLFAGGNLYETGSIAAGYSLITFTHTDGYWIASLTALEAATTQE